MRFFLLLFLSIFLLQGLQAQKKLKLYKGKKQAIEYFIGQEITFKLKNDETFYTFPIKDLFPGQILFPNGMIPLEKIDEVMSFRSRGAAKVFSKMLYVFGTSWTFFSIVDVTYGEGDIKEVGKTAAVVTGTSFALGYLIDKIFSSHRHKMKGKKFLQVVDLNVQPRE